MKRYNLYNFECTHHTSSFLYLQTFVIPVPRREILAISEAGRKSEQILAKQGPLIIMLPCVYQTCRSYAHFHTA